jgi:thiamine pyrophosphate-dependent acetolactate synthase large subunit-like protein
LLRARGARDYQPAAEVLPVGEALPPRPRQVNRLLEKLGRAKCRHRRGPRRDRRGAQAEVEELAERTGALLATTLPARGIFDHNPFSIGIAGGYAHEIAREIGAQADLVVLPRHRDSALTTAPSPPRNWRCACPAGRLRSPGKTPLAPRSMRFRARSFATTRAPFRLPPSRV